MNDVIGLAKQNPSKPIFATPVNNDGEHSKTSKSVDFAYILDVQESKTTEINTFDVTVQQNVSKRFQDINQSIKIQLKKISIREDILFTHIILCTNMNKMPKISQQLEKNHHTRLRIRIGFIESTYVQFSIDAKQTVQLLEFQSAKGLIKKIGSFISKEKKLNNLNLVPLPEAPEASKK